MQPLTVVKSFNPFCNKGSSNFSGGEEPGIDELGFQSTEKAFSNSIIPEVPQNPSLIHADASQLPLPEQSFDVVFTVHMFHSVSNWKTFLDEIDRVTLHIDYA